ncbi:MAG: hypothetical protein K6G38_00715, partial [Gammaproteobacteria bacterium]|nr:hypothetical protein [Gammaproteobacteria bacterium]
LVQVLLLLIPGVNWVVELVVRISAAFQHPTLVNVVMAIVVIVFGLPFGWLDLVWVLLFKHLLLCK